MHVFIDFETYSEAPIKDCGAWLYAAHPSTKMLCMAYAENAGNIKLTTDTAEAKQLIESWITNGFTIHAHNAQFEKFIAYHVLGITEALNPEHWSDTAALAAAQALPRSLGECGAALGLPQDQQKDKRGRYLIQKLCKPQRNGEYCNDEDLLNELYDYCKQDVIAEIAIYKTLRLLNDTERKVWEADSRINSRGVPVDLDSVKHAIALIDKQTEALNTEVVAITKGELDTTNRRAAVMEYAKAQGYELDGYTKQDVIKALADPNCPAVVRRLLEIRQQTGKTSTAKYAALEAITDPHDKRARGLLMYHGASTGRWTGKHFQPQNIPRGAISNANDAIELFANRDPDLLQLLYGDTMEVLSSALRGMICAPAGKKLVVADYSAIEARVLAWLAGQNDVLEVFRTHGKLYEHAASGIYRKPIEQVTKTERQIGKIACLALGYQGAAGAFHSMASAYGLELPDEQVNKIVKDWRNSNKAIVKFWYDLDRAAIQAVKTSERTSALNVQFKTQKDFLYCRLPSGRLLSYNRPQVKDTGKGEQVTYMGVNSYSRKWERQQLYGGKIAENITQAVARDLMAEAILRCEAAGYTIVLSVHDELIAEVPEDFGSVDEFEALMCVHPLWAKGLPLRAEGWQGKRYRK